MTSTDDPDLDPEALEVHVATLALLLDCDDAIVADVLGCHIDAATAQRDGLRRRYPTLAGPDRESSCALLRAGIRSRALFGEDLPDTELDEHLRSCAGCASLLAEIGVLSAGTAPERLPWGALGLTSRLVLDRLRDPDAGPLRAVRPLDGPRPEL